MPETDKQLRRELTEAIADVRRQIEIARSPSNMTPVVSGSPDNRSAIAALEAELAELEAALRDLEPPS
ncbi:MAG TPA: hypothetical protein VGF33_10700 [Caulobacteraceae bacterium]|jgi:malonyl CoA-acyl carrier protein transacylase